MKLILFALCLGAAAVHANEREFLGQFSDEGALSKSPNAADVLSPSVRAKPEKPQYGLIDASYGDSSAAQTLAGLNPGAGGDQFAQIKGGLNYRLRSGEADDMHLDYQLSEHYFAHAHQANYVFHDVSLPVAFYFGAYRLRFTPEFYYDEYSGQSFSNVYGGTFDVSGRIGDNYVSFALNRQQIRNVQPKTSFLSGYQNRVQISYQRHFDAAQVFVNVYGGVVGYQDTGDQKNAFTQEGVNAGYRLALGAYDVSVAGSAEFHAHQRGAHDAFARRDQKYAADLQLGAKVADARAYVDLNRTENKTNYRPGQNAYRIDQVLGGLAFGF